MRVPVRYLAAFGVVAALAFMAAPASAHDIPSDVRVQAFLKPEGERLRLIVRLPLASTMNDIEWPTEGARLDLARVDPALQEAARAWVVGRIDLYEGTRAITGARIVSAQVTLPSDQSFAAWDTAYARAMGPALTADTDVVAAQAFLDVLVEYPIESDRSLFSVDPHFALLGLRTETTLRFLPPAGAERAFQFHDDPGLVRLDPRWFQAAGRFVVDGFFHILGGVDHLLFLLCLVIPFRRLSPSSESSPGSPSRTPSRSSRRPTEWRPTSCGSRRSSRRSSRRRSCTWRSRTSSRPRCPGDG